MREWNPKLNQWVAAEGWAAHRYGGANTLPPRAGPSTVRIFWGVQYCVAVLREPAGVNELFVVFSEYQADGTWRELLRLDDYSFCEVADVIRSANAFLSQDPDD